jgi:Raf kinase inhibitor-like YbhB/YbcL family protein
VIGKRTNLWVALASVLLLAACKDEETGGSAGMGGAVAPGAGAGAGAAGAAGGLAGAGAGGAGMSGAGAGGAGAGGAGAGGASGAGAGGAGAGGAGAGGAGAGGAGAGGAGAGGMSGGAFTLTSSAVQNGQMIPATYRCEMPSPPLAWTGAPSGTMSYGIIFKDKTPGFSENYLHWVIYDIPAATMSLPMGVPIGAMPAMPAGAKQAPIWNDTVGYNGPCAPFGMNMYTFTLYAVNAATLPGVSGSSTGEEIETALEANNAGTATLNITSMP